MTRTLHLAIQGGPASFHETAAKELFPAADLRILSCASFPELCQSLASGAADYAVMAVQNSLAGPLLANYRLMAQHGLTITAERWLLLDQTLMALPGQTLADITEVWSHPIALIQCNDYLDNLPRVSTKETEDTADTARLLKQEKITGVAAIASRKAAELYGLEVLHSNVANDVENYTRFVVLSREQPAKVANKITLLLPYPVVKFDLENVLENLDRCDLELTMLQPLPSSNPGQPEEWLLELEAEQPACITQALAALTRISPTHTVLGLYPKAVAPLPQDRLAGCLSDLLKTQPELV